MLEKRIIPCLLLRDGLFVKTIQFDEILHISEPIYAIKIFNDYEVDELFIVDIMASRKIHHDKNDISTIPFELISKISDESCMPITYGGGISSIEQMKALFKAGIEKICISSHAIKHPDFIKEAASIFGSQSIVVTIDVKYGNDGTYDVWTNGGLHKIDFSLIECARVMEEMGAGEIVVNSIDNDGMMKGYDINMIKQVTQNVKIPVIALGGAKTYQDLKDVLREGGASAAAAGSMFVFFGKKKAVLINYPSRDEILDIIA